MTEIVFEDILTHYYLKIKQSVDDLENVILINNSILSLAESSWKGDASNAFLDKMMEMDKCIDEARIVLSESMKQIAEIHKLI
jgi:uncharacterized protein YukE